MSQPGKPGRTRAGWSQPRPTCHLPSSEPLQPEAERQHLKFPSQPLLQVQGSSALRGQGQVKLELPRVRSGVRDSPSAFKGEFPHCGTEGVSACLKQCLAEINVVVILSISCGMASVLFVWIVTQLL